LKGLNIKLAIGEVNPWQTKLADDL